MATRFLLDANFPESLHADICAVVGLGLDVVEMQAITKQAASQRRRDPQFRDAVLVAYEYRCAMCGYDGRLGTEAVACRSGPFGSCPRGDASQSRPAVSAGSTSPTRRTSPGLGTRPCSFSTAPNAISFGAPANPHATG